MTSLELNEKLPPSPSDPQARFRRPFTFRRAAGAARQVRIFARQFINVYELCQARLTSGATETQVGMDLRKAALLRSLLIKTEEKSNPTVLRSPSVDGMAVDDMSTSDLPNLQVMQAPASASMSGYLWANRACG